MSDQEHSDSFEQQEKVSQRLLEEHLSVDEIFAFSACCRDYFRALVSIQKYDEGTQITPNFADTASEEYSLCTTTANLIIKELKTYLNSRGENVNLFGIPNNGGIDTIVSNLYQTWDGRELYDGVANKAAHLFYFLVKDHVFCDGNKRIASFLFIWFIDMNDQLVTGVTNRTIPYNIIYTLAIFVAESNPKDKDIIINLIRDIVTGYSTTLPDDLSSDLE